MSLIRFISAFSFITLLLLFSQSLPTSPGGDGGKGEVSIPFRRALPSQQPPVRAGEEVAVDEHVGDNPTPDLTEKLRIHVKKVRGGGGGGGGIRARGKTSSSAVPTQLSSFHFTSVLGCCLFSVIFL